MNQKGFTLIETLVAVTIFAIVGTAIYSVFGKMLTFTATLHARSTASTIANEQFEVIRNLPYFKVGIVGGIPPGVIPYEQVVSKSGKTFTITTTVRNQDDPFDGILGGVPNDLSPADRKLVEIGITCNNCSDQSSVVFSGFVSPKSLETSSNNGALFVRVFDASGQPVIGADVRIERVVGTGTPVLINDVTNNLGLLQVVDVPPGTRAYSVQVSKDGYSTASTTATSTQIIYPILPHATVANQQVTQISLAIDRVGEVDINTKGETCMPIGGIDFNMKGTKLIAETPDLFKFNKNYVTDVSGYKNILDVEWDAYSVSLIDPSYDIIGTNPAVPMSILPGALQSLDMVVAPKLAKSLLISVKDQSSGLPLSDATVKIEKIGSSYQKSTFEGYFAQTDWSGGAGQNNWTNPSSYWSSDGNTETSLPVGDLQLREVFGTYNSSGEIVSSTFDIGTSSNYAFLRWYPADQPVPTGPSSVRFQVASSVDNTATTTWDFIGPDGTSGTYYTTSNQGLSGHHSGKRYMRYKLLLSTDNDSVTPVISDVFITFISSCIPPGQVFFNNLSSGTYTITVTKPGYTTKVDTVAVTMDSHSREILLSQ